MNFACNRQLFRQPFDQSVEIASHDRRNVGVHGRRRRSGVFAPFRRDLMRERDRYARKPIAEISRGLPARERNF